MYRGNRAVEKHMAQGPAPARRLPGLYESTHRITITCMCVLVGGVCLCGIFECPGVMWDRWLNALQYRLSLQETINLKYYTTILLQQTLNINASRERSQLSSDGCKHVNFIRFKLTRLLQLQSTDKLAVQRWSLCKPG